MLGSGEQGRGCGTILFHENPKCKAGKRVTRRTSNRNSQFTRKL